MKIRGRFCERTLTSKSALDQRSLRWKKSGRSWLLIGCPRGKWSASRCRTGTRAYKILAPQTGRRCPTGRPIAK